MWAVWAAVDLALVVGAKLAMLECVAYLLVTGPCVRRHDETDEWLGGLRPTARWATYDRPGALPSPQPRQSATPVLVPELRRGP